LPELPYFSHSLYEKVSNTIQQDTKARYFTSHILKSLFYWMKEGSKEGAANEKNQDSPSADAPVVTDFLTWGWYETERKRKAEIFNAVQIWAETITPLEGSQCAQERAVTGKSIIYQIPEGNSPLPVVPSLSCTSSSC
jgi:hypothetical protein